MPYISGGCYKAGKNAIPSLEGTDPILDGEYSTRENAIVKCFEVVAKRLFFVFAIRDGGECLSGDIAQHQYNRYPKSFTCPANGMGGKDIIHVYRPKGRA